MEEQISKLVFDSLQAINDGLDNDALKAVNLDTQLYGGVLDSLGLVRLIADLEAQILNNYGKAIDFLADEQAMDPTSSPFINVQNMVDYIAAVITETENEVVK